MVYTTKRLGWFVMYMHKYRIPSYIHFVELFLVMVKLIELVCFFVSCSAESLCSFFFSGVQIFFYSPVGFINGVNIIGGKLRG